MIGLMRFLPGQHWKIFAACLIGSLLAGCMPVAAPNASNLDSCNKPDFKFYTDSSYPELQGSQVKKVTDEIFAKAQQDLPTAKRQALRLLAYEAMRWSEAQPALGPNKILVNTLVTFITPGLIRAIALNETLYNTTDPNKRPDLEQITQKYLQKYEKENFFSFLIVLIPTNTPTTPQTFEIAPALIELHTTITGRQVKAIRSDDSLNNPLNMGEETYSGFFSFDNGIKIGDNCEKLFIPASETSITLKRLQATIGSAQNIALVWQIYFPPLYDENQPILNLDYPALANIEEINLKPRPIPSKWVSDQDPESSYWREMGTFIWWKLTR
jgi:hypothetical protein